MTHGQAAQGRSEMDEAFDLFWKTYPRKVAKKDAIRAWSRIAPKFYPVIMVALDRHKNLTAWKSKGGLFIPYAATWLNGERWEDEIPEPGMSGQKNGASTNAADRLIEYLKARRHLADMVPAERAAAYNLLHKLNTTWPNLRQQLLDDPQVEDHIRTVYSLTK